MTQHIEDLTQELNEYKERSIALVSKYKNYFILFNHFYLIYFTQSSLLETKYQENSSGNDENLIKIMNDKFDEIKEIKINYKHLLNILKLYKKIFTGYLFICLILFNLKNKLSQIKIQMFIWKNLVYSKKINLTFLLIILRKIMNQLLKIYINSNKELIYCQKINLLIFLICE